MFIAHLPAGYLATRLVLRHPLRSEAGTAWLMAAGLAGSVFPDIDLLRYAFVDHGLRHHHTYWTHLPAVWLILLGTALLLCQLWDNRTVFRTTAVFGLNLFLHLLLDSVVGDIWWLWPWLDSPFSLATVPTLYQPWYLNFLLHWSFALEVALCLAAVVTAWHDRRMTGSLLTPCPEVK